MIAIIPYYRVICLSSYTFIHKIEFVHVRRTFPMMNEVILNCLAISLSISVSNLIVQYIIEIYIRKNTYVTLAEYNLKMTYLESRGYMV